MTKTKTPTLPWGIGDTVAVPAAEAQDLSLRNGTLVKIEDRPFGLNYLVRFDGEERDGTWYTAGELRSPEHHWAD